MSIVGKRKRESVRKSRKGEEKKKRKEEKKRREKKEEEKRKGDRRLGTFFWGWVKVQETEEKEKRR
jgi:hypothetical protein